MVNKQLRAMGISAKYVSNQYMYFKAKAHVRELKCMSLKMFQKLFLKKMFNLTKEEYILLQDGKLYIQNTLNSFKDFYFTKHKPAHYAEEKAKELLEKGYIVCKSCGERKIINYTNFKINKNTKSGYELSTCRTCLIKRNKDRKETKELNDNLMTMILEKHAQYLG